MAATAVHPAISRLQVQPQWVEDRASSNKSFAPAQQNIVLRGGSYNQQRALRSRHYYF